jgi:hypothetical protein
MPGGSEGPRWIRSGALHRVLYEEDRAMSKREPIPHELDSWPEADLVAYRAGHIVDSKIDQVVQRLVGISGHA